MFFNNYLFRNLSNNAFPAISEFEFNKFSLLRIFFGIIIFVRGIYINEMLLPDEAELIFLSFLILLGAFFLIIGFLTQWVLIFFVFYMWPYLFKTKIDFLKCLSILLILTVSFFTIMRYGSFLINSLSFSFFGEGSVLTNDLDIDGYYIGSLSVLQEHIILPKGLEELVFGNGSRLIESDIGYYKVINSFGLVGLFFYIAYIGATYFFTLNKTSVTERRLILIPILIVLIIYNSKIS